MREFRIKSAPGGVDKKVNAIKAVRLLTSYGLKEAKKFMDDVCDDPSYTATLPVINEDGIREAREYFEGAGVVFMLDPDKENLYYDELRRLTKRAIDNADLRAARILMDTMEQIAA